MSMDKFAFVIHPTSMEWVYKYEPKVRDRREELIKKFIEWMAPFKLSNITGIKSKTGKSIRGYLIACPLLPEQILNKDREFVINKIIKCGKLAEKLNCSIIGLGAYTSVVGLGGKIVADNLSIAVTNGSSYTIATTIEAIKKGARLMNIDINKAIIAVIGATGSIGSTLSCILSKETATLVLVARNKNRLEQLSLTLKKNSSCKITTADDIKAAISDADIIITCTSSPYFLINKDDVKSNTLICDVSIPPNVSDDFKLRKDVLVIEGGVVKVPSEVNFNYDFGLGESNLVYACMAETMILTLEQKFVDYSIGVNINMEHVYEINELAKKHGFEVASLRSFGKNIIIN